MFVAKRDTANKYCEFLFKSMYTWFRLQQKMGIPVEGRIVGYMSEFLFGAYIDWFKLRTKTIHLRMT
jgi:hypothetical protein